MSDKTAVYAVKHHDLGKKDLWNTPGLKLPAYIQNVAHAMMRDHGYSKSRAIASAVNQCKRWAAGGEGVSPEVQAAAQKAIAEWEAAKAKARGTKSLSVITGSEITLAWDAAAHPRAAAGSPAGGQFVAQSSSSSKGQDKKGKGKNERERLIDSLVSKKGKDYEQAAGGRGKKGGSGKGGKQGKDGNSRPGKPGSHGERGRASTGIPKPKEATKEGPRPGQSGKPKLREGGGDGARPGLKVKTGVIKKGSAKDRRMIAAVKRAHAARRRELATAAREQGWSKSSDGWYTTSQRRGGQDMEVGYRQDGLGFQARRGGTTRTFRTLAQARRWASS